MFSRWKCKGIKEGISNCEKHLKFFRPTAVRRKLVFSSSSPTTLPAPIPEPASEDFTAEAQKVIRFSNLHPRTRRQFLQSELGDFVEHLFPDSLSVRTPSSAMPRDELPPVPGLTRKRKAVPPSGPSKNSRGTGGASGSGKQSESVPAKDSARQVPNVSPSTALQPTHQAAGEVTDQPTAVGPSAPSGSNQGSTPSGPRVLRDASAPWKPTFKDLSGKLLTVGHSGRDNSAVSGLIQNNVTLPKDVEFMEQQSSGYLALYSAQSRYNATAADQAITHRLLRYEDYINSLCRSLGCTRQDSMIERLNALKAEAEKAKVSMDKVAELEKELDKTKDAEEKIASLNRDLDKAKAEVTMVQAAVDRAKADKEAAVKELVDANLMLAREKKGREEAEKTIEEWRPNYMLGIRKISSLLDVSQKHMHSCRSFRDDIRPFMQEFEADSIDEFDEDTAAMDRGENLESPVVDKALVSQTDELVDITEAQRRDEERPMLEE